MKFTGIRKASKRTKFLDYWNGRVQINYDPSNGTVWTNYFHDVNSGKEYHDCRIISFYTRLPMTVTEIKNQIMFEIAEKEK